MQYKKLLYHLTILLLSLEFSYSKTISYSKCKNNNNKVKKDTNVINIGSNSTVTYNFYCLKDYNDCGIINHDLREILYISYNVIPSYPSLTKFDAIVDDFSKYNLSTENDNIFILLNSKFEPITEPMKGKFKTYPNSKTLRKKIYYKNNKENPDFIIVFNNLKNIPKYRNGMNAYYELTMLKGIVNGMTFSEKDNILNTIDMLLKGENIKDTEKSDNTLLFKNDNSMKKKDMKYKRIVAVGDIHGDYNQLVSILRNAKLINKKNKWIGYDSILVQMGDLVDRGSDTKKVLDLMIDIREQAKRKGGKVNVILGNHETNIMQGYYLYTYICDLMEFGTLEDRKKAFSLNHKYGNFLRKEMEPVIIIDDILFTHGGLIKKYAELGIDNLNKKIHNILMETPYDFSLYDKGENSTEPIVSDLMMDDGPTWSRRYTSFKPDEEKEACDELSEVLKMTNTTRMVVGHTVQKDGLIKTKCDNKLVVVDIGITASYGSHFGYLEINRKNNEFWAIYNKTMNN